MIVISQNERDINQEVESIALKLKERLCQIDQENTKRSKTKSLWENSDE